MHSTSWQVNFSSLEGCVSRMIIPLAAFDALDRSFASLVVPVAVDSSNISAPQQVYRVLIRERNDQAVSEIYRARQEGCNRVSLIYGVMHATDLARKFQGMGFSESIETKWRRAWKIDDDDGFVPNFVTMAALTLLVGSSSLHWWEMVYWLQQSNECLWYGGKEVVESMWPNTDVVVSVVQYLQCPGESFAAAECRATLGYFGLHLLMYKIIRSVLL